MYIDKKANPKVSKDGWITEAIATETKAGTSISIEITDSKDKKIVKQMAYVIEKKDQEANASLTPPSALKVQGPPATLGTTTTQGANQAPSTQVPATQQSTAPVQSAKPPQNPAQAATQSQSSASK